MSQVDFVGNVEAAVGQDEPPQAVAEDDEGQERMAPGMDEAVDHAQALFRPLEADGFRNQFAKDPENKAEDDGHDDVDEP